MKQSNLLAMRSILLLSLSLSSEVEGSSFFSCLSSRDVVEEEEYGIPIGSVKPAPNLPNETPNYTLNHFTDRPEGFTPRALVMHYTVCNWNTTLKLFCEAPNEVSAHYVVSEKQEGVVDGGVIARTVPEDKRAWHAGPSEWRDIVCDVRDGKSRGLNSASIGIENVNKGFTDEGNIRKWYPFDQQQINTLGVLSSGIVKKYGILAANVVGHSDICIGIKPDPGVLFPWGQLYYQHGVGAWLTPDELEGRFSKDVVVKETRPNGVSAPYFLNRTREYGYTGIPDGATEITPELTPFLTAFRMHFSSNQKPDKLDEPLNENDMAWAHGLTIKYPKEPLR